MTHPVDAPFLASTFTSLIYIVLGLWVLTVTPRRLQTKLLAAFAILFGLTFAIDRLALTLHLYELPSTANLFRSALFRVLYTGAALGLAWSVPEVLEDRRMVGMAVALGLLLAVPEIVAEVALPRYDVPLYGVLTAIREAGAGILYASVALLALRAHPSRCEDPSAVRQLALLALAFAVLEGFLSGADIATTAVTLAIGDPGWIRRPFDVLPWLVLAGLWAWNMIQADEDTVRIHRAAALGILALLAGGALFYVLVFPDAPLYAVVTPPRILGLGLLAYGILRHDIAGLDAKVEFGLSKTTVAGIFIAVFFIVSEGAQALFADFAGNEFLGVIAAGALVFAISPLQRFADRFAAKAVPGGGQAGQGSEASYRRAVRLALTDGEITREEEHELAQMADQMGISAGRALELREQIEDEVSGGDGG